ncbi:hypothetical protein [Lysobacter sp. HA35]
MKDQIVADLGAESLRAAPAVTMSAASAVGLTDFLGPAQLLVYALTALLIGLQAAYLVWKWRRDMRQKAPE